MESFVGGLGGFRSGPPNRLDPETLGLSGEELRIARIISEETEAERARQGEEQPLEVEPVAFADGLLGSGVTLTPEEARKKRLDAIPWDRLLTQGTAHTHCVERSGLSYPDLIRFALVRCRPVNSDALFWYEQWTREIFSGTAPAADVADILARKSEEAARERKAVAASGGAAKAAKYAEPEAWVALQWLAHGQGKKSKRAFAEAIVKEVQAEYDGLTVSPSTITDVWLSPSRLAKHLG